MFSKSAKSVSLYLALRISRLNGSTSAALSLALLRILYLSKPSSAPTFCLHYLVAPHPSPLMMTSTVSWVIALRWVALESTIQPRLPIASLQNPRQ
ncbi:hypothetical protein ACHAXS_006826 [Conticribra weissflogii]